MRGYPSTWASSRSADRRGAWTSLRVKKALVHSSSLRTVHGAAASVMAVDCRVKPMRDQGQAESRPFRLNKTAASMSTGSLPPAGAGLVQQRIEGGTVARPSAIALL